MPPTTVKQVASAKSAQEAWPENAVIARRAIGSKGNAEV